MGLFKKSLAAGVSLVCIAVLTGGCGGSREARRNTEREPRVIVREGPASQKSGPVVVETGPGPVVVQEGPVAVAGAPAPAKGNGPPDHAPAHGYRRKQAQQYSYHYYPSRYVYYSPKRGLYWYMRSGRWEVSVSIPDFLGSDLGEFVVVNSENDAPYVEFEAHKTAYPVEGGKDKGKAKAKGKGNGKGKGKEKGPGGPGE